MQVFEFHFNPKAKPDLILDSFCFEPENAYEKRAGSLYMVGLLKSALPQNTRFLSNLSRVIEEKFFKVTLRGPEKALQDSLKVGNEFLESIAKKGDVSWMGNLSFATLSLKDFELNFTKVGNIKILLLRRGQIIDIDKRLNFQDLEPYPLKVFPNIVSGKMAEGDLILIFTKELFDSFRSQNLIGELSKISPFDDKKLKEVFRKKSKEMSKMTGILLLLNLNRERAANSKQIVLPQKSREPKEKKEFSLKEVFALPLIRLEWPRFPGWNKSVISASSLILFLVIGFFVSKYEGDKKLKLYSTALSRIEAKATGAEKMKNAPDLIAGWEDISSLIKTSSDLPKNFQDQASSIKDKISQDLFLLNKLIRLDEPILLAEANKEEIISQKIISDGDNVYIYSPYSKNILKISGDGSKQILQADDKFNFALNLDDSILFFAKPDKFLILGKDGKFSELSIAVPSDSFGTTQVFSFQSNLYFYDKKTGDIQKDQYLENLKWSQPAVWTIGRTIKPADAVSLAANASVWVLTGDNKIQRYYAGYFQETLNIDLFPYPKNFTKILAVPPYLYVLEPALSRVIIFDKSGGIVKQFQSQKFDNLLDFAVSQDGKIIYVLNGQKVYKILF